MRRIAHMGLEEAGYEVLEAGNADEAIRVLQSRRDVEVLFTDVQLPGPIDGLVLADIVRESWPCVGLVVTSGRLTPRNAPREAAFLEKPYSPQDLLRTMRRVVKRGDQPAS